MDDIEIYNKMNAIAETPQFSMIFGDDSDLSRKIADHKAWLQCIRNERPNTSTSFKVGIYIRYYNQTKYDNYLSYHKKQFTDTVALCPKWKLIDFYIDEGANAPNMETAPAWSQLLTDCFNGKIDLIITQKVRNVSQKPYEVSMCARLLAAQKHPIGIYFISEDIYTLASYYNEDLHDDYFLPGPDWKLLPDSEDEMRDLPDD